MFFARIVEKRQLGSIFSAIKLNIVHKLEIHLKLSYKKQLHALSDLLLKIKG